MRHIKPINEFFFGGKKIPKVGDEVTCKKECGFSGAYKQLPRLYDFEVGSTYVVTKVSDDIITVESDQDTYFSDKKSKRSFTLEKDTDPNPNYLFFWDFFEV